MKQKTINPIWIWICVGVLLIWIYSTYTSKPVSSLEATTKEARSVYAGPNVNYGVIGQIKANSKITLIGRKGETWVVFNLNGQQGWIQEFFLDIEGNASRLPDVKYVPIPTPTVQIAKDQIIRTFLEALIIDSRYDTSISVLHKYIDSLDIKISGSTLTYTLWRDTDSPDELVALSRDLIWASVIVSNTGESSDWNLSTVELYWPGPQQSFARLYITGHTNLVSVARSEADIYDLLETEINYGNEQQPSKGNSPLVSCSCSSNVYDCLDFSSQEEAQACYNYCLPIAGDIHWLDDDGDQRACELLR